MGESKFKRGLVSGVKKEIKEERKQEALRDKYNVRAADGEGKKIVVVEKSHLVVNIVKTAVTVAVYLLALAGLLSIIYPETRVGLLGIFGEVGEQLKAFLPFL